MLYFLKYIKYIFIFADFRLGKKKVITTLFIILIINRETMEYTCGVGKLFWRVNDKTTVNILQQTL